MPPGTLLDFVRGGMVWGIIPAPHSTPHQSRNPAFPARFHLKPHATLDAPWL